MRELFKWDSGGGGDGGAASKLRRIIAGLGLFGGGDLSDDITINVGEGPGIDVTEDAIGLGGDTILLYDSGGNPVAEFAATNAGLTAALAAMAAGDVAELPDVTITGGPWEVYYGTLKGHSRFGSILDGELTAGIDTIVSRLSVVRDETSADVIYGIILFDNARADDCFVSVINENDDAIGIGSSPDGGGDTYANDCIVLSTSVSGDGWAYKAGGGNVYASGGYAYGSTSPVGI